MVTVATVNSSLIVSTEPHVPLLRQTSVSELGRQCDLIEIGTRDRGIASKRCLDVPNQPARTLRLVVP
jgi:hypothetical protein